MTTKQKRGLGRGLDALLDPYIPDDPIPSKQVVSVPIRSLDTNADQPRKTFDETSLNELAESIRVHGIVQPLIVIRKKDRYLIIAGERRFRAAKLAGLEELPVIVAKYDAAEIHEVSLIENIQRENLNPIEEASAIRFLMEQYDMTQEEVSERIGKSRSSVANSIRLLSLPESVMEKLRTGSLSVGHGKLLAGLDSEGTAEMLADEAVRLGYSVRTLEARIRNLQKPVRQGSKNKKDLSANLSAAETALRNRLLTKVCIKGEEGKGKIIIEYYSKDDLDRIYSILLGGNQNES